MKILIVYAHPEPKSFNGAMKELAVSVLEQQGHLVRVSDLYAMKFKAVAGKDDFLELSNPNHFNLLKEQSFAYKNQKFADDIVREQEKVSWADFIILQFPLWWSDPPAILKGWLDRVLAAGFAYGPGLYDQGNLRGKKAMLSITTGSEKEVFGVNKIKGQLEERLYNIQHETLFFCGLTVLEPFIAYSPEWGNSETRKKYLSKYELLLTNIDSAPFISYPHLLDYDEHYQLKRTFKKIVRKLEKTTIN